MSLLDGITIFKDGKAHQIYFTCQKCGCEFAVVEKMCDSEIHSVTGEMYDTSYTQYSHICPKCSAKCINADGSPLSGIPVSGSNRDIYGNECGKETATGYAEPKQGFFKRLISSIPWLN